MNKNHKKKLKIIYLKYDIIHILTYKIFSQKKLKNDEI